MATELVVVRPFGTHAKGEIITDPATVAAILAGELATCVVRVIVPAAPAAASNGQGG